MTFASPSVNFGADDVHTLELLVPRGCARGKVRDALRLFIGRGRRFSVAEVSLGSGVPVRAIEAAMAPVEDENYRPPTLENLLSIATFLGAPFVSHYLALSGLGAFELMDGQPPLPRMLASAPASDETVTDKRRRLLRELQSLEE